MRHLKRHILVFALAFAGVASVGQSQVLTFDTNAGFDADTAYGNSLALSDGIASTQTFTNITSFNYVSVRLLTESTADYTGFALNTYFSEWSDSDASSTTFAAIAVLSDRTFNNDGATSFYYYDALLDLTSFDSLSSTETYGLTLVGDVNTQSAGLRIAGASTAYADGQTYVHLSSDLSTGGAPGADGFGFTATETSAPFSPVPEASTITVLFAGIFASGMVGFQLRKRRQAAAAAALA